MSVQSAFTPGARSPRGIPLKAPAVLKTGKKASGVVPPDAKRPKAPAISKTGASSLKSLDVSKTGGKASGAHSPSAMSPGIPVSSGAGSSAMTPLGAVSPGEKSGQLTFAWGRPPSCNPLSTGRSRRGRVFHLLMIPSSRRRRPSSPLHRARLVNDG
jgi:hypothetical protein